MKFLKNLALLVFVFLLPTVAYAENGITIRWDGNTASAYQSTPPLWEQDFPSDFPKQCLEEAVKSRRAVCAPVERATRLYFNNLAAWNSYKSTHYSVALTDTGVQVSAKVDVPFAKKNLFVTAFLVYIMPICFAVLAIMNALKKKTKQLFFAYAAVALAIIVGGTVGTIVSEEVTGGVTGVVAGALAGALAGGVTGGVTGVVAGVSAGEFTGIIVSQSGWIGGGINEYLIFLAFLSLAGFALRGSIALAMRHQRKLMTEDSAET